ncbi:37671_t:CDS:2 [Gigaspora margarita]|uniref:37671_t:CDS:1 n=1 Tax=Gigaspora margarita TaxID=4874 RepID=A0ABN7UE40_GIGMA|nr:37671_t:CDS:2 [Gigaspora margarita]
MLQLLVYLLLACLVGYYFFRQSIPHGLKKLPSPPGQKFYTEWAKNLGDIYAIHMGQQYWIILTSVKAAVELLQKRGGKYSSRMPNYYFLPSQRNVKEKSDLIDLKYPLNIITLISVARRIKSTEDSSFKYFENFQKSHLEFVKVTNRLVIEHRNVLESFYGSFVNEVKDDKEKKPCAIRDLLNKDTISASLTWIVAALANNPQVQSKAHEELDRVVGQSRLPTISDEPNIPYIRAIINEDQRYCGPTHLDMPHYIEKDDEYNGYHIPANSAVVLKIYGIHTDEKRHVKIPKTGRRLCTGIHLAELGLLLGVSRLLWSFKIENASPLGKDGKPIPIKI